MRRASRKSQCPRQMPIAPGYLAARAINASVSHDRFSLRGNLTKNVIGIRTTLSHPSSPNQFGFRPRVLGTVLSWRKSLQQPFSIPAEGLTLHNVLALWVRCHRHVRISIRVRMGRKVPQPRTLLAARRLRNALVYPADLNRGRAWRRPVFEPICPPTIRVRLVCVSCVSVHNEEPTYCLPAPPPEFLHMAFSGHARLMRLQDASSFQQS